MTQRDEVLADSPTAYYQLKEGALPALVNLEWPSDQRFTFETGYPFVDSGDIATAVVTPTGEVVSAYVNGEPAAVDHPSIVKMMENWALPRLSAQAPSSSSAATSFAYWDRVLSVEEIKAHHRAHED